MPKCPTPYPPPLPSPVIVLLAGWIYLNFALTCIVYHIWIMGWVSHETQLCISQVFIAGFLRCNRRTRMKSFLKKIARKFLGNFVGFLCKFPVNSRAIFLRNGFLIVRLSHLRNHVKNLQIAELRLMRNPSHMVLDLLVYNL